MSEDVPSESPARRAGEVYGPLFVSMLTEQSARKASIEQRALAVITTSGGLVSLLVALSALLLGKNATLRLNAGSRAIIIAAVVAFVAAAILALIANTPRGYGDFADEDVNRMMEEFDTASEEDARWVVAERRAKMLKLAMKINDGKAHLLQVAVATEVAGVALVALGVVLTLA